MPLIQVSLITGRTADQKRRLIADLTDATVRCLDVPKETIRVILTEVPAEHWGVGGVPKG